MGEDHHRLIIEQHRLFVQAKRRIQRAQKKRNGRVNKGRKEVGLSVGDPHVLQNSPKRRKAGPEVGTVL